MRIVVCVKQAYDPATVRVSRSREEFDLRGATKIMNPADRHALEAALRLREAAEGEVIVLTVGDPAAEDVAHEAVAIGADRGLFVEAPAAAQAGGSAVVGAIVAGLQRVMPVDLVLTGEIGAMDGTGSLAPRLAAALDWPVAIDVALLEPDGAGVVATVAGDKRLAAHSMPLALPAVASILAGAERPRYPHAARIANAWLPGSVERCTAEDLGLEGSVVGDIEVGGLILGPERTRGQVIGGDLDEATDALMAVLRAERIVPAA